MLKSAISMMAVHILLVFFVALALGSTVGDLLYPDMEQPQLYLQQPSFDGAFTLSQYP